MIELLKIIYKVEIEFALAMANLCLRKVVAICSTSLTAAQSLLILLQRSYLSVRKLCRWIFAHFLLSLRSLMHMLRSNFSLKIYPASIADAVPTSTETAVLHAEYCSSSLDSAHAAESSFSPSFRLRVQKRLTELAAPIRTRSAPATIRMSSTRNTATQKGFKQLRYRSNMIRNSCAHAFELKKDDKISVDLDVSTKPSMHHILRSSSFSVNSRSQMIDEHRNRNAFTSMNVMQTKGKAIESNTCSRLAILNEHAVIGGSSLLLVLSTLSLGRFPAILFTSMSWIAILFIKAYLETGSWTSNGLSGLSLSSKSFSQEINKSSTSATYQMDFTSNKYKKKVIMEGILERNHGIFQT